jgi:hypothetical protein
MASAQSVRVKTYQGTNSSPTSSTTVSSGDDIPITVDYQISRICIFTDGGGDSANIGEVKIVHTGGTARSSELQVILMDRPANLGFPDATTNLSPVATNWEGITFDTGVNTWGTVSGSISGDLTNVITANKIVRIEIGDEVTAAVTATATGTAIEYIEVGKSTSAGTITATNGNIDKVNTTLSGSTIEGGISATSGSIGIVTAAGSISISSGGIQARDGITSITAKNITCDIAANANSGDGILYAGVHVTDGNLSGSIAAAAIYDGSNDPDGNIVVDGDFDATITVDGDMYGIVKVFGECVSGSSIWIGGRLIDGIDVYGDITSVTVVGDIDHNFGGSATPPHIVSETGFIDSITLGNVVYVSSEDMGGYFTAATGIGSFSAAEFAGLIEMTGGGKVPLGSLHITGDMEWEINAVLEGDGFIDGYCTGNLYLGKIEDGILLRLNGAFTGNMEIGNPTGEGLEGQVVMADSWTTGQLLVRDGDSLLQDITPDYTIPSGSLGGGAVGEYPYTIHTYDSSPVNGDTACMESLTRTWSTAPYERETIVLSHKGKVFDSLPSTGSIPLVVLRQPLSCPYGQPCPGSATDISSSCTVAVGQGTNGREVWICMTPANSSTPVSFGSPYRFTITPRVDGGTTDLRSDQTGLGTAPNVYSYTYVIDTLCD